MCSRIMLDKPLCEVLNVLTLNTEAQMNEIKDRFDKISAKIGKDKAIERARAYAGSLILGRNFLETCEDFAARKPEYRAIKEWLREIND